MTHVGMKFQHGQEVMVFDAQDTYQCRGIIIARSSKDGQQLYDVQPNRTKGLSDVVRNIPEYRLRQVSAPIAAYERKIPQGAKHVKDDA